MSEFIPEWYPPMKQISFPNYEKLSQTLNESASLKLHPSQGHGLLCGLLCGNPKSNPSWEEIINNIHDEIQNPKLSQELYEISSQHLAEFSFDFQLLLPSDEDELRNRAEALSVWCQGFLTGLELMHISITNRPKNEMSETINDLIEIAKMNYDDVVSNEEDEMAYVELVEYVRMAVIMIYQELRDNDSKIISSSV